MQRAGSALADATRELGPEETHDPDPGTAAVRRVLPAGAPAVSLTVRPARLVRRALDGLWFIPVLCVLGGVLLSVATIAIDRAYDFQIIPEWLTGGPDAALGILTTIAA